MTAKTAFLLQPNPAVRDALERIGDAKLRSVNAGIEFLLRDALAARGISPKRRRRPAGRQADVRRQIQRTRLKRRNNSASIANMLKMASG